MKTMQHVVYFNPNLFPVIFEFQRKDVFKVQIPILRRLKIYPISYVFKLKKKWEFL